MHNTITDSVLFLSIIRDTICEMIDNPEIDEYEQLQYFIKNEATDYQIMGYMVTGEMPVEGYDIDGEVELWESFRGFIADNYQSLSEFMTPEVMDNVLYEIGPVTLLGLSSARPIMEFQLKTGYYDELLSEANVVDKAKEKYAAWKKQQEKKREEAKKRLKKDIEAGKDKAKDIKKGVEKAGRSVAAGLYKAFQKGKGKIQKATGHPVKGAISSIKGTVGASQIKHPTAWKAGKIGAAVAGASLAAYAAYKLYKNHLSKAARACKSADNKAQCMKDYKVQALKMKIAKLEQGKSMCAKASNPEKCTASIDKKVEREKAKLAKAQG